MLRAELARGHIRAEGEVALTISVSCCRVTRPRMHAHVRTHPQHARTHAPDKTYKIFDQYKLLIEICFRLRVARTI